MAKNCHQCFQGNKTALSHITPRLFTVLVTAVFCANFIQCTSTESQLERGVIRHSTHFSTDTLFIEPSSRPDSAFLTISGSDIIVDFQNSLLDGRGAGLDPDGYNGIAIRIIDSKNVTLKNLSVHGFKIAVYCSNVTDLTIENCNFSYNYRPRLFSRWDREAISDWLYFHQNDNDEWLRYGSAMYLTNCHAPTVLNVNVTEGFNGLLMTRCDSGTIYNNNFSYNSGLGIGLYRSSGNKIMHNKLDWNVRGYSHGKYARGQDSAGILLYEQCSNNTIAFNSATHCGDGLFLWAGQSTMDSGQGGCDSNVIYKNDFSHSVANGIEVTFSANYIIENTLHDCRYGIWGGYSHHTRIVKNSIRDCDYGVAIEHGNNNLIIGNKISNTTLGIKLWERKTQPADWGYSTARDVSSRNYIIADNQFDSLETALDIKNSQRVSLRRNTFSNIDSEILHDTSGTVHDSLYGLQNPVPVHFTLPSPMEKGQDVTLEEKQHQGRKYIVIDEWGPYSFNYPKLVLREKDVTDDSKVYRISLFGPVGNWKLVDAEGVSDVIPKTGSVPGAVEVRSNKEDQLVKIELEYIGEDYIARDGRKVARGEITTLTFSEFSAQGQWQIEFYPIDSFSQQGVPAQIKDLFGLKLPVASESSNELAYTWWESPHAGIINNRFATRSTNNIYFKAGEYIIQTESDDGIRVMLDDRQIIDNWTIHEATIDRVKIAIDSGWHEFTVEHFNAGGMGALSFHIIPLTDSTAAF